ncbi:MAG: sigma-54 dependent transcriptional regulator [Polyangia bacterium]
MSGGGRILVVDDERSMREMLAILLRRAGHHAVTQPSGEKAIAFLGKGERFDLVITDLLMDRGDGIEVLEAVKRLDPDCEVIVITAFATTDTAVEAMKKGAFDYIAKPFNNDELLIIVKHALERRTLRTENVNLRARIHGEYTFADMIGRSKPMREVIDICKKVAPSAASVLITGESGTGKELVARAIHSGGPRSQGPFMAINCGALPEPLMESEMFGHVRGAFTGATEDKQGLLQAAHGGTVFLDEVGELPPAVQVKLLRVLQERTVRPVGGSREIEIDVRVLSASNLDIDRLVEQGGFRKDLFYRLNVIRLRLPPLRERREDILLLVEALRKRLAAESGHPPPEISPAATRALVEHDWPGNVRELANVLERASTLCEGDRVEVGDLSPEVTGSSRASGSGVEALPEGGVDLDATLAGVERSLIEQALERTGKVRKSAADLLGVSFRSLRYRLNKHGIEVDDE